MIQWIFQGKFGPSHHITRGKKKSEVAIIRQWVSTCHQNIRGI
jgi:hypothetical protein